MHKKSGMEKVMAKILILDGSTLGSDIDMSELEKIGEVISYETSSRSEAISRIKEHDPDVIINNKVVLDEEVLSCAKSLKMIAETATGYNNIDIKYAKAHGIRVANVAGYSTNSVVQHTFALAFYVLEKLNYYDNYVKSGEYAKCPIFTHFTEVFPEIYGKTWGIVGLGTIGRSVAKVADAFGCKVVTYSASGHKYDSKYEQLEWEEFLKKSDIISIHAPLNEYTNNLFNYDAFSKMKESAVLINVGRGPIINDADLCRALNEGIIAGAGLDVIGEEPISADNPLCSVKDSRKLIITPHIAWATYEARVRLVHEVAENIKAFLNGEERNVVA